MKVIPKEKLIVRDSFLLPFRGSAIWAVELDSLSVYTDLVTEKFLKDIAYAKRPSTPSLLAIHVNNTATPDEFLKLVAGELTSSVHIRKVALIGLAFFPKRKLKGYLEKKKAGFSYCFINDYEKAKEWLVPSK